MYSDVTRIPPESCGIIMVLVFLTLNVQEQKGLQYLVVSMTILTLWAMR